MGYALQTLWYERKRYLPGVLAVAFSSLLVGLQIGLLLGLFSSASLTIDHTQADVWVGGRGVASVDQGRPLADSALDFFTDLPEVERCESFVQGGAMWVRPDGGAEPCMVVGSRLGADALGAARELSLELRERLEEPGAIVIDESDLGRLGITGLGAATEISNQRVHVVGMVHGLKGLAHAYIFCSVPTARKLLGLQPDRTTFLLVRCPNPAAAAVVVERLREDTRLVAFTSADFSLRSRLYWLTKTKAGMALGWTAVLGLLVGAAITSQTLYAATAASLREYAVLRALGIPRWRTAVQVLAQSLGVGMLGAVLALPCVFGLRLGAEVLGAHVHLPLWLLGGMTMVTLAVALISGLAGMRLVVKVDPAILLRG